MKTFMAVVVVCAWLSAEALPVFPVVGVPYSFARPFGVPLLAARPAAVPVLTPHVAKAAAHVENYDPNPQYSYAYNIQDALTGDSKSQQESRSGDVVQGSYSVVDPDGVRRVVKYSADPHNGFNAVVHREPVGKVVAKAVAQIRVAPAYLH